MQLTAYPPTFSAARFSGSRYYFTGVPCTRGHVALRDLTQTGTCVECRRASKIALSPKQREAAKVRDRARRARHRTENPLPPRKPGRTPAEVRAAGKAWREANRERYRELVREWRARNKEELRADKKLRRKARRVRFIREQMVKQRGECVYCRTAITPKTLHVDHIQPLARGGTNRRANLQLLCPPCNLAKSDKDPCDFMFERFG